MSWFKSKKIVDTVDLNAVAEEAVMNKAVALFSEKIRGEYTQYGWYDFKEKFRDYLIKEVTGAAEKKINVTIKSKVTSEVNKIYDDRGNIRADLIQQIVEAVNKSQVKSK